MRAPGPSLPSFAVRVMWAVPCWLFSWRDCRSPVPLAWVKHRRRPCRGPTNALSDRGPHSPTMLVLLEALTERPRGTLPPFGGQKHCRNKETKNVACAIWAPATGINSFRAPSGCLWSCTFLLEAPRRGAKDPVRACLRRCASAVGLIIQSAKRVFSFVSAIIICTRGRVNSECLL